jgi:hypothetical protein|uniref:NET domain-containing protein n=1 Tax=viral metagenome TaxID=1070528 RepID=A0A6C0BWN7_9ZZZZ
MPYELAKMRDTIENLNKEQQIQILRLFKENKIPINENKNGVFINLTGMSDDILSKLDTHLEHIISQENLLKTTEDVKKTYKDNYFDKDIKDNLIDTINNGNI